MKTKYTLLITLFHLIPFLTFSQEQLPHRQAIGISVITNYTKPLSITRNLTSPLANITSKPILGYEGRLEYRFMITERLCLEAGALFGLYPYRFDLYVAEEFAGLPWGDHDEPYKEYEDNIYAGVAIGLSYAFPISKRSEVTLGAGFDYIFHFGYWSGQYGIGYFVEPDTHISIYSMAISSAPDGGVLMFPPELKIRYNFRAGKRILLSAFLNWVPSNRTIMSGTYSILGTDQSLTGSLEKQSGHAGAGISGYFMF